MGVTPDDHRAKIAAATNTRTAPPSNLTTFRLKNRDSTVIMCGREGALISIQLEMYR
jgi:hypothetical protein